MLGPQRGEAVINSCYFHQPSPTVELGKSMDHLGARAAASSITNDKESFPYVHPTLLPITTIALPKAQTHWSPLLLSFPSLPPLIQQPLSLPKSGTWLSRGESLNRDTNSKEGCLREQQGE